MKIPSTYRPFKHWPTSTLVEEIQWLQENVEWLNLKSVQYERMTNELKRRNS